MGEAARRPGGRRVLIPGGFGFIGSHLLKACLQHGDEVTVISYQRTRPSIPVEGFYRHLQLDLRDSEAVRATLAHESYDVVFNLCGYIDHSPIKKHGRQVMDQHMGSLLNLLDTIDLSALKAFIQVGSSDEYGNAPAPQHEELREAPIAPYSLAKTAATHFVQMLHRTQSFPGVVVRFFLVYGPGQDEQRFLPQIIQGCLANKDFAASEGRQERDFVFVDDVVSALLRAAEVSLAHGQVINIASGVPVTIRKVVEQVVSLCGSGRPQYGVIPYRAGENMRLFAAVEKAKKLLSWSPTTSLEQGLRQTIDFYRHA